MKLKITLIVLSLFILLAAGYVAWWMIFNAEFQMEAPIQENGKIIGYTILSPEHGVLSNLARYGSVLLLLLGIFLLINAMVRKASSILSIAAGFLTAVLAFIVSIWGYPLTFHSEGTIQGNSQMIMSISPGPTEVFAQEVTAVIVLLALAITGVSIAQLIKSKKTSNS